MNIIYKAITIAALLVASFNVKALKLDYSKLSAGVGFDPTFIIQQSSGKEFGEKRFGGEAPLPYFVELRYQFKHASLYASQYGFGGDIKLIEYKKFSLHFGGQYGIIHPELVNTDFSYMLRAKYEISEFWAISLQHISNGASVFGKNDFVGFMPHGDDKNRNQGFNFIMINKSF